MADVSFTLNGKPVSISTSGDRMLLWVLRTEMEQTGVKFGCGQGICGACTVLIDGEAVRSCVYPLVDVAGKEVTTIEGLAQNGKLHPVQEAFVQHDAQQCGFCTPGMIMTACDLLSKNPEPTREQIIDRMEDSLCRCGAHNRIVQAIESAAQAMARRK